MRETELTSRYGKKAMITGASSGIGEQFARLLAREGFDLLLAARRESVLRSLQEELERDCAITVTYHVCDLNDQSQVDALVAQALEQEVGLVVSNAGFGVEKGRFVESSLEEMEAMYQTNSVAPARIARLLLPPMLERNCGGFIFTGSMEGDAVFPYSAGYASSKAFLHSLAMALWHETRGSSVDILLLAPGSTDTQAPISQGISPDQLVGVMSPELVAEQALSRLGHQPHFTPGVHNRFFMTLLRLLPRKWAISMAGVGMKQAIDKSRRAGAPPQR